MIGVSSSKAYRSDYPKFDSFFKALDQKRIPYFFFCNFPPLIGKIELSHSSRALHNLVDCVGYASWWRQCNPSPFFLFFLLSYVDVVEVNSGGSW